MAKKITICGEVSWQYGNSWAVSAKAHLNQQQPKYIFLGIFWDEASHLLTIVRLPIDLIDNLKVVLPKEIFFMSLNLIWETLVI